MKFGKILSNQIEETLPEWRDKFLSYKKLKKQLKQIDRQGDGGDRSNKRLRFAVGDFRDDDVEKDINTSMMTTEEIDFINLLEAELYKFNSFFVEKEEEYIIRLKELKDRVAKSKESNEELIKIQREIVDFHGEMVLLENYSALNYTGLVKILKKYDKRTGALIRLPFIQKVLRQPFFTTDLLYKLVKECEIMLDLLFPVKQPSVSTNVADGNEEFDDDPPRNPDATKKDGLFIIPRELAEIEYMEGLYMKSTVSALRILKKIRSGSSTVSMFSLPPLQNVVLEDTSEEKM